MRCGLLVADGLPVVLGSCRRMREVTMRDGIGGDRSARRGRCRREDTQREEQAAATIHETCSTLYMKCEQYHPGCALTPAQGAGSVLIMTLWSTS